MSEVFSNFLGNIPLSLTDVIFVKMVSKEKIKVGKIFLAVYLSLMVITHTMIVYFI